MTVETTTQKAPIDEGVLDEYVEQAARAAGYEDGFGVRGCDLSQPG